MSRPESIFVNCGCLEEVAMWAAVTELLSFGSHSDYSRKGLHNIGNTCFLNAVLQALACCPEFFDLLTALQHQHCHKYDISPLSREVLMIIEGITGENRTNSTLSAKKVVVELSKQGQRWIATGAQQDAYEALVLILAIVDKEKERWLHRGGIAVQEEELLRPSMYLFNTDRGIINYGSYKLGPERQEHNSSLASVVKHNPFEFALSTSKHCTICKQSSSCKLTTTSTLSLPVVDPEAPGRVYTSLFQCLQGYLAVEMLEGVYCDHCTASRITAHYSVASNRHRTTAHDSQRPHAARSLRGVELVKLGVMGTTDRYLHEAYYESTGCKSLLDDARLTRTTVQALRVTEVMTLPATLILHLRRESFDHRRGEVRKLSHPLSFPTLLGFDQPQSTTTTPTTTTGGYRVATYPEMAAHQYDLVAVIKHVSAPGAANQGHYICFVRDKEQGQRQGQGTGRREGGWLAISDDSVWSVPSVQCQGDTVMLFYEKRKSNIWYKM